MRKWPIAFKLISACFLIFPLVAFSEMGSELGRFEEDATLPRKTAPTTTTAAASSHSEPGLGGELFKLVAEITLDVVTYGGVYSWERVVPLTVSSTADEERAAPRTLGEGLIPYARVDASTVHTRVEESSSSQVSHSCVIGACFIVQQLRGEGARQRGYFG